MNSGTKTFAETGECYTTAGHGLIFSSQLPLFNCPIKRKTLFRNCNQKFALYLAFIGALCGPRDPFPRLCVFSVRIQRSFTTLKMKKGGRKQKRENSPTSAENVCLSLEKVQTQVVAVLLSRCTRARAPPAAGGGFLEVHSWDFLPL